MRRTCETCEYNNNTQENGVLGCACSELTKILFGNRNSEVIDFNDNVIRKIIDVIALHTDCEFYKQSTQQMALNIDDMDMCKRHII